MDIKVKELKEAFEKRYSKQFTEEEIKLHCVSIVYSGVFKKNWSLNGVKVRELD